MPQLDIETLLSTDIESQARSLLEARTEISEWLGPGVYLLLNEEEVLYVGTGKNMLERIGAHCMRREIKFTRVQVIRIDSQQERDAAEASLIIFLQPKHNKMHTDKPKRKAVNSPRPYITNPINDNRFLIDDDWNY